MAIRNDRTFWRRGACYSTHAHTLLDLDCDGDIHGSATPAYLGARLYLFHVSITCNRNLGRLRRNCDDGCFRDCNASNPRCRPILNLKNSGG